MLRRCQRSAGSCVMARRHAGKSSPRIAPERDRGRPGKVKAVAVPEAALKERLGALERERDALRAALEHEQARVRKLEELNATARDRIAWALDSLQNILGSKG
jgi:hypothetical protein